MMRVKGGLWQATSSAVGLGSVSVGIVGMVWVCVKWSHTERIKRRQGMVQFWCPGPLCFLMLLLLLLLLLLLFLFLVCLCCLAAPLGASAVCRLVLSAPSSCASTPTPTPTPTPTSTPTSRGL